MLTRISESVVRLYRYGAIGRFLALKFVNRFDGGEMHSATLREIFRRYHGVTVGAYTHGGCFERFAFGRNTTIGRYTSVARSAFASTIDHPTAFKGMHGFFFNSTLGYTTHQRVYEPLEIGNDVWLGHNSIINASVRRIGDGAVVGAGAVVFKDVPPYAVVVGNPARVVRYRFDPDTIQSLLAEQWWNKDMDNLVHRITQFDRPLMDPAVPGEASDSGTVGSADNPANVSNSMQRR